MADSPALTDVRDLLLRAENYMRRVNDLWAALHPEEAAELNPDLEILEEQEALNRLCDGAGALRLSAFRVQRRIERGELK